MRLSCQLYTVRDQFADDPRGTLEQLRATGLEYVEGGAFFGGSTAEEGKKMLDDAGLKASGSHAGLKDLETEPNKVIDTAKTLGYSHVVLSSFGKDVYGDGWDKAGKRLEPIGAKLKEAGMTLAYHNHAFEFQNEGKPGLDQMYEASDPALVQAQIDIAWVHIGGKDPAEYIRKLSNRLPLLHLKDYDPAQTPQWQPCGQGVIDWKACADAWKDVDIKFGAIELDESPGEPMDAVRESVAFFNSMGIR